MTPVQGGGGDPGVLAAAALVAAPFEAQVVAVYAPPDVADLIPWMGDGYMGGVEPSALEGLREAGDIGESNARRAFEACTYHNKAFVRLETPVWASLAAQGRLSDLVVFDDAAARGSGPLAAYFQQTVVSEQRPTLVVRKGLALKAPVAVAWEGGKEASRAMRTALPLLRQASEVVILQIPASMPRRADPELLQTFLADRGIGSKVERLSDPGEPGHAIVRSAQRLGVSILVAGAFGHARLREFMFGGATRAFLLADAPSLFLSH